MTPTAAVLSLLQASPHTLDELRRASGLPRRMVEEAVQLARLDGAPIVSDSEGIRLAANSAEVFECAEALRRRAVTQMLTARALRATARRMSAREAVPLAFWAEDDAA